MRLINNTTKPKRYINHFHSSADRSVPQAIKTMAILFTDIIGSTDFFKSYGNVAGRKMLQQHENIASETIKRFGGTIVKNLGDSVMAYFLDSQETVKSAIKIQKEFQQYNEKKDIRDQIHVRIGIHFGEGIIENKDIFGDVVNVASKLTNLAGGDQIFISQEVFSLTQDLSQVQFSLVNTSHNKKAPKGLTVYRVIWDDNVNFDPIVKTILYIKPAWELGVTELYKIWDDLITTKDHFWGNKIENERISTDRSIVLITKKPAFALDVAHEVLTFVRKNLGKDNAFTVVPIQIIIDAGPYLGTDKLDIEGLEVHWEKIHPGKIYISTLAHNLLKKRKNPSFVIPPPDSNKNNNNSFYELIIDDSRQKDSPFLFLYQNALLQGKNPPCFYCGSKGHATSDCPSKHLTDITQAFHRLGYLSFDKINDIFFTYLEKKNDDQQAGMNTSKDLSDSGLLAHYGFYELKQVFQLRFLKSIWNAQVNTWNKITKTKNVKEDEEGFIWLAQDCIRVSNFTQAESLLETFLEKYPQDYKVHCAMGFLNIEKNNFHRAEYYLNKAISYARTKPQKIFILLLLSRLHDLDDNIDKASEKIRAINLINSSCPEVIYQDIVFRFRQKREIEAIRKLIELILQIREYYVIALIDPDLAPFNKMIHRELKRLFNEAKNETQKMIPDAENELSKFENLLGKEDKEVKKAYSLLSEISELSKTDSYFGYLDMARHCVAINHICHKTTEARIKDFTDALTKLDNNLEEKLRFARDYHRRVFINPVYGQLKVIRTKTDQMWKMVRTGNARQFKEMFSQIKEISQELKKIEPKLKRLQIIQEIDLFVTKFSKNSFIILAIIFFVATIIFPIIIYYLNILLPDFNTPALHDTWFYQKRLLFIGSAGGLLLAIIKTLKEMFEA